MKALFVLCAIAFACAAQAAEDTPVAPTGEPVVTAPVATPNGIVDAPVAGTAPVPPGTTVTTTTTTKSVTPEGLPQVTTTMQVETVHPKSRTVHFTDNTKVEIDSDGGAYQVFPDGARTAAPDGVHLLMEGGQVTIKDGKVIP